MPKKLFFLLAMPRSGNTLLASLLNQNPKMACTGKSLVPFIIENLLSLKKIDVFENFPDHKSLDNVIENVFNNYYNKWPQSIIIDRSPLMCQNYFLAIQKYLKHPFKCIVLLRDVMDILASYMKWYTENPDAFVNYSFTVDNDTAIKTDEDKLNMLMNNQGDILRELDSIKTSVKYPDICHYVKYNDLVANPEKELRTIYKFIEEPYYPHFFKDLQQLNLNGISYNDSILGKNMHRIRSIVRKEYNPYIEKIPERIRKKYGHIKF